MTIKHKEQEVGEKAVRGQREGGGSTQEPLTEPLMKILP
jgi:hypothetical protein